MISKKSRKVVAALLIGATVCASGTFAYFNSIKDLGDIMNGDNEASKVLNITNGHVEIDGKIASVTVGDVQSNWTYDVARINYGLTEQTAISAYENINRSPDISGVDKTNWTNVDTTYTDRNGNTINKTISRANIGAPVTGVITNARPGDAIVLGIAQAGGATDKLGVKFVNKSNILTNIRVDVDRDNAGKIKDSVVEEFKKLAKAGWIVEINGEVYDFNRTGYKDLVEPTKPEAYGIDLNDDSGSDAYFKKFETYKNYASASEANAARSANDTAYNTAKAAYDTAKNEFVDSLEDMVKEVYAVEATDDISVGTELDQSDFGLTIRFELPLATGNKYQDAQTTDGTAGDDGVDIRNIFKIVATQENNPGWNQDGTKEQPWTQN